MSLGALIKERRLALGLSQETLAMEAGVAQEVISRLERGGLVRSPVPAPEPLSMIAVLLGVTVDHLLGAAGYPVGMDQVGRVPAIDMRLMRHEVIRQMGALQRAFGELMQLMEADESYDTVVTRGDEP